MNLNFDLFLISKYLEVVYLSHRTDEFLEETERLSNTTNSIITFEVEKVENVTVA